MDRIEKRINLLHNLKKQRMNNLLREYDLSYEEYQIVLALHYSEGMEISEIKNETKLSHHIIDNVLNHLEEKDYLNVKDGKLYLTEKTEKLYPQMKKIIKRDDEILAKSIGVNEVHELVGALDKLIELYE